MNYKMKISVIAAVYNVLVALQLIVSAIRSQTYTNFELVTAEGARQELNRRHLKAVNNIKISHITQNEAISFINSEILNDHTIIELVDNTHHLHNSISKILILSLQQSATMRHSNNVSQ